MILQIHAIFVSQTPSPANLDISGSTQVDASVEWWHNRPCYRGKPASWKSGEKPRQETRVFDI